MSTVVTPGYRGRFAPSPTGPLHFGSLIAAVGSWLRARSLGGAWLVRMEDIDPPREVAGARQSILDTLAGFGLVSDEPVLFQHTRGDAYAAALQALIADGYVFPCACTRTDVRARGGHRGRCPPPPPGRRHTPAWRMLAPAVEIGFDDALQGRYAQRLDRDVGDFVLRRTDGLWAYQLAVVVDDATQGITEIVRGADLLDSTPRQIALQRALGQPTPAYAHLPVLLGADGRKLSKQTHAPPVEVGDPLPVLRQVLNVLGLPPTVGTTARTPDALLAAAVPAFDFDRIPSAAVLRSATWTSMANG